ncbi:MAG: peptidoglycan-associated lipoprotein Pal [Proteobacteria bacterium]|nr:peptidoglycan-associated lipoprotein Pal [Pseudomonadota bacterium]
MKKFLVAVILLFIFTGCAKEKMAVKPSPVLTDTAKEEKSDVAKKPIYSEEKAKVEDFSGLKALTPEEITPDMIAKAQISLSDQTVEKGVLAKMIHFDFDSYEIKADAKDILKEIANYLNEYKSLNIIIEGHCDERGTREYNLALGLKRAEATKRYLTDLGIDEKRLNIISFGEDKPLDPASNESAWAKNRRAQFKRAQ